MVTIFIIDATIYVSVYQYSLESVRCRKCESTKMQESVGFKQKISHVCKLLNDGSQAEYISSAF